MFKNSYQSGLLSIFYSCGAHPLALWETEVNNGHIKRLTDNEVNSIVLEIVSTNVATTYITCPAKNKSLGIKLPFLVMILKNLKRYFSFEITILDDKNMRRRFRISNFQSTTKIKPFCTTMPIGLSGGWNQIQFNLSDFTRRAYGSQFVETLRVQVHANVRLRRIYFAERLYTEEELPQDYKLYLPLEKKGKKAKEKKAAAATPPTVTAIDAPQAETEGPPRPELSPVAEMPQTEVPERKTSIAEARVSSTAEERKSTGSRKSTSATPVTEATDENVPTEAGEATPVEIDNVAEVPAETLEGEVVLDEERPETPVETVDTPADAPEDIPNVEEPVAETPAEG